MMEWLFPTKLTETTEPKPMWDYSIPLNDGAAYTIGITVDNRAQILVGTYALTMNERALGHFIEQLELVKKQLAENENAAITEQDEDDV